MATPLLKTKLYIPPFRPELVSRPRLIEQLNAGMTRKLTLISAPAGFGKTTLLSEWASHFGSFGYAQDRLRISDRRRKTRQKSAICNPQIAIPTISPIANGKCAFASNA